MLTMLHLVPVWAWIILACVAGTLLAGLLNILVDRMQNDLTATRIQILKQRSPYFSDEELIEEVGALLEVERKERTV